MTIAVGFFQKKTECCSFFLNSFNPSMSPFLLSLMSALLLPPKVSLLPIPSSKTTMNPFLLSLLPPLLLLPPSIHAEPFSFPRFPSNPLKVFQKHREEQSHKNSYETKHFTQTLDHFNYHPESYATFQQRYLINAGHWGGAAQSAPIFAYTGNEGPIEIFAEITGFMFDVAPAFNALLIFMEHRYYGNSFPFGSEEAAFENGTTAGFLSTSQALADFAALIVDLKKNLSAENSPVVVFGGSYGGMLAAWFRLKYPHLAIAALASSAPILQIDPNFDPYTFNNIITKDFRSASENCYKVIKSSWDEIDRAIKHDNEKEKMEKSLKLCKDQVNGVKQWLTKAFIYSAMIDYPTPSNFLQPIPANPVNEMCKAIDNPRTGNDTYAKLYGAMNVYYNYTGTAGECFNLSIDAVQRLGTAYGWFWQVCTEMILPTDGNNKESIFQPSAPTSVEDRMRFCQDFENVKPRFSWLNTEFGANNIKRALKRYGSNIIFFNGLKDPWSGGGVLKSISRTITAIVELRGAHHVDLRASTKDDPKWLQNVRKKEVRIIKQWLREYYEDFSISSNI